jgi:hypothetical protein
LDQSIFITCGREEIVLANMVLLNKSVYLDGGDTIMCEYENDDLTLGPLWICLFVVSLLLNLFAVIGNLVVIVACYMQRKRPPLIIYIQALAISDLIYALIAPFYIYR